MAPSSSSEFLNQQPKKRINIRFLSKIPKDFPYKFLLKTVRDSCGNLMFMWFSGSLLASDEIFRLQDRREGAPTYKIGGTASRDAF